MTDAAIELGLVPQEVVFSVPAATARRFIVQELPPRMKSLAGEIPFRLWGIAGAATDRAQGSGPPGYRVEIQVVPRAKPDPGIVRGMCESVQAGLAGIVAAAGGNWGQAPPPRYEKLIQRFKSDQNLAAHLDFMAADTRLIIDTYRILLEQGEEGPDWLTRLWQFQFLMRALGAEPESLAGDLRTSMRRFLVTDAASASRFEALRTGAAETWNSNPELREGVREIWEGESSDWDDLAREHEGEFAGIARRIDRRVIDAADWNFTLWRGFVHQHALRTDQRAEEEALMILVLAEFLSAREG